MHNKCMGLYGNLSHITPFGRNESEQNEDDGATRSETRESQVVCFAYIFQTIFENVFCTL